MEHEKHVLLSLELSSSLCTRATLARITAAPERSHALRTLATVGNGCKIRHRLHDDHLVLLLRLRGVEDATLYLSLDAGVHQRPLNEGELRNCPHWRS